MSPSLCLTIVFGLFALCKYTAGKAYDPCQVQVPGKRGDAWPIGIALIPGGNASNLIMETLSNVLPWGFCDPAFQTVLQQNYSATLAIYQVRLDRLQVLRVPFTDILFPLTNATLQGRLPTVTAVAFSGRIHSTPVYIASGTNWTGGAGFVISLALMARFNRGDLTGLTWYDLTCNSCGGRTSQACIQQVDVLSCATPFINCSCTAFNESPDNQGKNCSYLDPFFEPCAVAINMGFLGTDRNDQAFRTGPQVQRLNSFSLVSLFFTVKDFLATQWDTIYSNVASQWSDMAYEADANRVEFGGGFGSVTRGGAGEASAPPPPPPSPPAPPPVPPSPPSAPLPPMAPR